MATLAAPSPSRLAYSARRRGTSRARPPRLNLEPAEIDRKSSKKGENKAPGNGVATWPTKEDRVEVTLESLSISDNDVTEWTAFPSVLDRRDQFEGRHDEQKGRSNDVSEVRCPEESNSSWMREPIDAKNLNRVQIIPAPDDEQSQDENVDSSNQSHRRTPSSSSKSRGTPSNARPPVIGGSSSRSVATNASSQAGRPPIPAGNGSNSDSDSSNNNSSGGENSAANNSTSSRRILSRRGRSSSRRRMEPKERSVSRGRKVPDAPSSESQTQSRRGRSRSIGSRTSSANISSTSIGRSVQGVAATSPSTTGQNRGRSNSRARKNNNTESATASGRSRSVNPSPNSSSDMKRNSRSKSRKRAPSPSVRSAGSPSAAARPTGILSPRSIGVNGGTPRARRGQIPPFHRRSTSDLSSDNFAPPQSPGAHHVRTRSQSPMRREFQRSPSVIRKEGGLVEKLFGDAVPNEARKSYLPSPQAGAMSSAASMASGMSAMAPDVIHSRTLLTATVYNNTATKLWITTINTNQKPGGTNRSNASKYLKAFSFKTEREARESAIANAPPRMIPFSESPQCFICQGKFAVFRRASHCRNCGTCVCSSCSVSWPAKMIPETYNLKTESVVKVCKSCNYLSGSFRKALLDGDYDESVALYNTGNVNLRCPCKVSKGEVMYPIHAAVEGGNLDLVRWLVDEHYCPIKLIRTSNKVGTRKRGNDIPILTSKGRSVLNIAMTYPKVNLLRYLVREKGVSVHEMKDLKTALGALEAVLHAAPAPVDNDGFLPEGEFGIGDSYSGDYSEEESIDSREEYEANEKHGDSSADGSVVDACIICYENSIDCVITPCGHQICCLACSTNLEICPVCNVQCQFIRIFRP